MLRIPSYNQSTEHRTHNGIANPHPHLPLHLLAAGPRIRPDALLAPAAPRRRGPRQRADSPAAAASKGFRRDAGGGVWLFAATQYQRRQEACCRQAYGWLRNKVQGEVWTMQAGRRLPP